MTLVFAVTYQHRRLRVCPVWIVPLFDDDVDMEVAGKQHDVYWQALRIIVSQCNLYAEFARCLLDDTAHAEWGTIERFDHRTLQHAHDLLAAVWRFRHDYRQLLLPFVDTVEDRLDEVQALWLDWLRQEIAGWIEHPDRVRLVQVILMNQNKTPGNVAESQLALNIIEGFRDVPWHRKRREVYEASIVSHRTVIQG